MLDGTDWDETKWEWKKSLLKLRKYVSNKDDDIFIKNIKNDTKTDSEEVNSNWI